MHTFLVETGAIVQQLLQVCTHPAGNVCHINPAPIRMQLGVDPAIWVSNMRLAGWQEQLLAGGHIRSSTSAAPFEGLGFRVWNHCAM